jgi:hypothetical protein
MTKLNLRLFVCFLFAGTLAFAQKQETVFEVIFKGKKVGTLHAQETKSASKSFKELTVDTKSTFLLIPIHMESEIRITQEKGILIEGTAYRNASRKSSDVNATIRKIGFRLYERERNGVKDKMKSKPIRFCVVDLYFKEPLRVNQVFSNMYVEMLQLKRIDTGKYQLITPDNNHSTYTYANGKLVSIEADTLIGKIVSKRI